MPFYSDFHPLYIFVSHATVLNSTAILFTRVTPKVMCYAKKPCLKPILEISYVAIITFIESSYSIQNIKNKKTLDIELKKEKVTITQNFVCQPACQPICHSCKARGQKKQCTATILCHCNKLTGGMYVQ